jgi:hypothetical protein
MAHFKSRQWILGFLYPSSRFKSQTQFELKRNPPKTQKEFNFYTFII